MTKTPDHAARTHALLSPSSAHRWLACTPSALLEAGEPDRTTCFSEEGTLAHEFAEVYLRDEPRAEETLKKLRTHELYAPEMEEHAKDYASYVRGKIGEGTLAVEQRLDLNGWAPGSFGTADCLILSDERLTVIDYKYGKGVKVEADNNPQLKLYALGALDAFGFAYDMPRVELDIFQPRLDNVSEWGITRSDLVGWGNVYARPHAEMAAKGEGYPLAGAHCQFCRYARKCKTLAEYSLAVASEDFEDESGRLNTNELKPSDWQRILTRAPIVKKWLELVDSEALNKLMADPKSIPGFKVVEGRSVRKYNDTAVCAELLAAAGYKPEEFNKPAELKGVTDMTKLLGSKKFNEILGAQIVKPQGKPTVVPMDDKRPVFQPAIGEDFADESLF